MLKQSEIDKLKQQYPAGTKILLQHMEGEERMPSGLKGTVKSVDDIGQIHVRWENGSGLALNVEEDTFHIIQPEKNKTEDEKMMDKFRGRINAILEKTDFNRLSLSCIEGNEDYAKEVLNSLHDAFVSVYGDDILERELGMVMMPAVIRGKETGNTTLGLVLLDLESSGEHWETIFFTPRGVVSHGDRDTYKEIYKFVKENIGAYDYWYTPITEHDIHVDYSKIPEEVMEIGGKLFDRKGGMDFNMEMN